MIEQLAVVVEAHAAIEQVAPAGDARGIDVANRTDHQIERQPKLRAELGQHPEDGAADLLMLVGTEVQPVNRLADRGGRSPRRCAAGGEVRRQADRAGPGARARRTARTAGRWPPAGLRNPERRRPTRPASRAIVLRLVQLQDQVVGPQARDVRRRVPAVQRVVELVGEEHGLQPAGLPDLAVPCRAVALDGRLDRAARRCSWA